MDRREARGAGGKGREVQGVRRDERGAQGTRRKAQGL